MKLDIIPLLIPAALCAAGVWLQFILSKKESKWPGLILPGISFVMSLLALFGAAVYDSGTWKDTFFTAVSILFPLNIPTFIFMAVYAACRSGKRKEKDLEKMNVQDL